MKTDPRNEHLIILHTSVVRTSYHTGGVSGTMHKDMSRCMLLNLGNEIRILGLIFDMTRVARAGIDVLCKQ